MEIKANTWKETATILILVLQNISTQKISISILQSH